ncbi:hypothetical protein GCM10027084_03010 [Pseudoxanthomonas sangjuensis]|uniref:alanine acetyltransferase n=1 Tax=Pseudoxanthomonas sangjuensis TaxID=1503750 RepID=UPI0013911F7A|nr:alanine acetyltransferase [Pseudoxanthomonas sangjuensis]KAF1708283.1 alanine acetyltransferase [Pseudoxanthomonas sangjuensis]
MSDAAPWTAEQQRWLAALGHTVWVRGALPVAEAAQAPAETPMPALPPARREFQARAPGRPQAGRPAARPAPAPRDGTDSAPVAAPRRVATRMPDRLHIALIRAAGINPNSPEMADVVAQLPASAELRGNPAAKRALWPRLRALRAKARR